MLYDDAHGMGHLPFFSYICKSLEEEYDLYVLLWNGLSEEYFLWAKVIKIQSKKNSELYNASRFKQIEEILIDLAPDVFLIDFFPFGRYWNILEINLITSFIKDKGWKNISIMRDIYLWKKVLKKQWYDKFLEILYDKKWKDINWVIENDYRWFFDIIFKWKIHHIFLIQAYLSYSISKNIIDWILVFGDKKIFDISSELVLEQGEEEFFHHIGYIPEAKTKIWSIEPRKNSILISTGGNVTSEKDFENLMLYMNSLSGYSIRVLLGPYVSREYKKKIISMVYSNKNITVTGFVDNFTELLLSSQYFFGFWWYGTFQSLFHYTGRAYIMSNYDDKDFKHRYYEQKYRTIHLKDFLNVEFLSDFSFGNLDLCMKDQTKHAKKKKIGFCSPSKLVKVINKIIDTNK
jgi:predicted glycosyltransferase